MTAETQTPVIMVYPCGIEERLKQYCKLACVTPAVIRSSIVKRGVWFTCEVEAVDVPTVEAAAALLSAWDAEERAIFARWLTAGTPGPRDCGPEILAHRLDTIRRWYRDETAASRREIVPASLLLISERAEAGKPIRLGSEGANSAARALGPAHWVRATRREWETATEALEAAGKIKRGKTKRGTAVWLPAGTAPAPLIDSNKSKLGDTTNGNPVRLPATAVADEISAHSA